jgi:hypothetical protein
MRGQTPPQRRGAAWTSPSHRFRRPAEAGSDDEAGRRGGGTEKQPPSRARRGRRRRDGRVGHGDGGEGREKAAGHETGAASTTQKRQPPDRAETEEDI